MMNPIIGFRCGKDEDAFLKVFIEQVNKLDCTNSELAKTATMIGFAQAVKEIKKQKQLKEKQKSLWTTPTLTR